MTEAAVVPRKRRFIMYVPNSEFTRFHDRSPWLMFPRSFQETGYESTLICARFAGEQPPGVRIVETSLVVKNPRNGGRIRSLVEPVLAFREILFQRPDIVVVGPIRSSLFTVLPLVCLYRLVSPPGRFGRTRFILKADWSLDCTGLSAMEATLTKLLLVLSTFFLDLVSIETYCGVERARRLPYIRLKKVARVPLGFPQGVVSRKAYESMPREPVILCVARIARMKGQDVLLDAFLLLASRFPSWSIRLVGPVDDPAFKDELRRMASRDGLADRVVFLGFLEQAEIDREFARASVFCLPSIHSESAGQVKYEATAYGLPVVTTEIPCAQDAVEMGWLVARAGDPTDLAAKLEGLMRDEEERKRVSGLAQSKQRSYLDMVKVYLSAAGVS